MFLKNLIKRKKLLNQKGFSLVELMVVVAIIGILAAIAIPNYQKFQRKSQQVEAKTIMSGLYANQITFMNEWNALSAAFDQIGFEAIGDVPKYTVGWVTGSEVANTTNAPGYRGPPTAATALFNTGQGTATTAAIGPLGCREKTYCNSAALIAAFGTANAPDCSGAAGTCKGSCASGTYQNPGTIAAGECNDGATTPTIVACSCGFMADGKMEAEFRSFVIGAAGDIGGSQADYWYMTYNKEIRNTKSGVE